MRVGGVYLLLNLSIGGKIRLLVIFLLREAIGIKLRMVTILRN